MRLLQYVTRLAPNALRVGVETKTGDILDLNLLFGQQDLTMVSFLEKGNEGMQVVEKALANADGHFQIKQNAIIRKAPVTGPEKLLCVGMNYVDHCVEQGFPIPTEPIIFNKFPSTIISSGENVLKSNLTEELDFEVELAVVIGKGGRYISEEKALDHVAGYTVAHDVSARDWQLKRNGGQWLLGKTFDTFTPLGPVLVTKDELKVEDTGIRCILNGTPVQESSTKQLIFSVAYCVKWISTFVTLKPGDIILTGTPPGVGCFRNPPLFLKDGDVVTCEIDGIGAITNTIRNDPHIAKL